MTRPVYGGPDGARALMARTGLSAAAISRATGLATATVSQRLRRYPPRPAPGGPHTDDARMDGLLQDDVRSDTQARH